MAEYLKCLGQSTPASGVATVLYQVPSGGMASTSTMFACNTTASSGVFRLYVQQSGAASPTTGVTSGYVYYNVAVPPGDTFAATVGLTLAQGDKTWVYTNLSGLVFSAYGAEIV